MIGALDQLPPRDMSIDATHMLAPPNECGRRRGFVVLGKDDCSAAGPGLRLPTGTYVAAIGVALRAIADARKPVLRVALVAVDDPNIELSTKLFLLEDLQSDDGRTCAHFRFSVEPREPSSRYDLRINTGGNADAAVLSLHVSEEVPAVPAPGVRSLLHLMTRRDVPPRLTGPLTVLWGPNVGLRAGVHEVEFLVRFSGVDDETAPILRFDVSVDNGARQLVTCDALAKDFLPAGYDRSFKIRFTVGPRQHRERFEFRAWTLGNADTDIVDVRLRLVRHEEALPWRLDLLHAPARPTSLHLDGGGGAFSGEEQHAAAVFAKDIHLQSGYHHFEVLFETFGPVAANAPVLSVQLQCRCCGQHVIDRQFKLDDVWPAQGRSLALLPVSIPRESEGGPFRLQVAATDWTMPVLQNIVLFSRVDSGADPGMSLLPHVLPNQRLLRRSRSGFVLRPVTSDEFTPVIEQLPVSGGVYELELELGEIPDAPGPLLGLALRGAGARTTAFTTMVRRSDLERDGSGLRLPIHVSPSLGAGGVDIALWSHGDVEIVVRDLRLRRLAPRERLMNDPEYVRVLTSYLVPSTGVPWTTDGYRVARELPPAPILSGKFVNNWVGAVALDLVLSLWNVPDSELPIVRVTVGPVGGAPFCDHPLTRRNFRRRASLCRASIEILMPSASVDSELVVTLHHLGSADWALRGIELRRRRPLVVVVAGIVDFLRHLTGRAVRRVGSRSNRRRPGVGPASRSQSQW